MSIIYKLLARTIDLYAGFREKISPGWLSKNSSRVREWKLMARAFSRSRTGVLGGAIVVGVIVIAIVGPAISWEPYWVYKVVENPELQYHQPCIPPSCTGYPLFGADEWGRDIIAVSLYGIRISLITSIFVVLIGAFIGIALGLIAGYRGGVVDEAIMRLTDIFIAFPGLILAIAFASALPQRIRGALEANPWLTGILSFIFGLRPEEYGQLAALLSVWIAMAVVWWPGYARIVRGSVMSVREQPFVEAAKLLGLSTREILVKHILPNIVSPVIVMVTFDLATATLLAASLSFLGVGPQEPVPDLGFVISKAGSFFPERSWHVVTYLGSILLIMALGWNLLGDALRDVLDPRARRAIELKGGEK